MRIESTLLQAYRDSYFFINNEIRFADFFVITAWNPFSQPVSNEDNQSANRKLKREILKQNYVILHVGDRKRQWVEESFAVQIPASEAVELGRKYRQNAIYQVTEDVLWLVSCIDKNSIPEKIGLFSERIIRQQSGDRELK